MNSFTELAAWQSARELRKSISELARSFLPGFIFYLKKAKIEKESTVTT